MRRVHEIPPTACSVCETARFEPRFAEFFAFAERSRRPTETLLAAMQRVTMDAVFDFYGDDVPSIARALSVNPSTVAHMKRRRDDDRKLLRLVEKSA